MTPRVSGVISGYQTEPYVESAIRYALDQDDASQDGKTEIPLYLKQGLN
jgi:hypothetical protein